MSNAEESKSATRRGSLLGRGVGPDAQADAAVGINVGVVDFGSKGASRRLSQRGGEKGRGGQE